MSLAQVQTRALLGIDAVAVLVEVDLSPGLPGLSIVGLPATAVKESKDRVRAALLNSQFDFPNRRITINLSPADLPKEGGRYDLPIAIALLCASGTLAADAVQELELIGELGLGGALLPVPGALPTALAAADTGRALIVPRGNADEAALASGCTVFAADHLLAVVAHLVGQQSLPRWQSKDAPKSPPISSNLTDIKGQYQAKRVLEVAAAGGHNMLMLGPPGVGKSMLAQCLSALLPVLTEDEALATAAIRSVVGEGLSASDWRQRPFRSPHHSISGVALVGGGSHPRPGEISLAHNGILFLDELPEFARGALEVLREPMENGRVTISRAARRATFPSRFQLVTAMNPCPCGLLGDAGGICRCSPDQIRHYRSRLSGPFLDRIDLQIEVPRVPVSQLQEVAKAGSDSISVRHRVAAARQRQRQRAGKINALLNTRELERYCPLAPPLQKMFEHTLERLHLSARAYHRILRVARSIADLGASETIEEEMLMEAIAYRRLRW